MELTIDQVLKKAVEAHKTGRIQEADKLYSAILQVQPEHPDANHNLGLLAISLKKIEQGLPFLKKAIEANPHIEQFWMSYIDALIQAGELSEARQVVDRASAYGINGEFLKQQKNRINVNKKRGQSLKRKRSKQKNAKRKKNGWQLQEPTSEEIATVIAFYNQGELEMAIESASKLVQQFPHSAALNNLLGASYSGIGNQDAAIASYRKASSLNPTFPDPHNNLGIELMRRGEFEAAIVSYQKAIELKPNYAEAHNNLGQAHWSMGDIEAAIIFFSKAIKIRPDYVEAHVNRCDLYEKCNRLSDLQESISEATAIFVELPNDILLFEALLDYRSKNYERALEILNSINIEQLANIRKIKFFELRAKSLQRRGEFNLAFHSFSQMNKTVKESIEYRRQNAQIYFDDLIDKVSRLKKASIYFDYGKISGLIEPPPNFLIGFPRSGTTLLDTILRSHSAIEVIEECPMIDKAKASLGKDYIEGESEGPNNDQLVKARQIYYSELEKYTSSKDSMCVIDKLPLNILNMPFMCQLFPNAKFILALRHPLDSILSCWMQYFGPNPAMANMLDLERIVDFYCLAMTIFEVSEKMQYTAVHSIRYEDVVNDMKLEISSLLKFLDLEWEETLTDFQGTALKRAQINTPSYSQVIQPIYTSASYRWENYREHLEPYFGKVEKWVTRFGYKL